MSRILPLLSLLASVPLWAAAPLVSGAMPPLHERPSQGVAITGHDLLGNGTDQTMKVCMIRVQFLEDFTSETSGNGRMDLGADPPHDIDYFRGIADDIASYYADVSKGKLDLDIDIYPSVSTSSYTMQHQMIYYGNDDSYMQGSCELMRDAITAADADIDFSQYDAVIIIHAGSGQEADIYGDSPGDIGSLFLTLTDLIFYLPEAGLDYQGVPTNDGVYVAESMIVPEQESQDGYGLGVLGTIVHEFGHQLGLPDLYDTSTGKVGVGGWDLMGYGQWMMSGYWPSSLSAWCRIYLGWEKARVVDNGTFSVAQTDSILRVPLTGSEYLLIENRQRDPDGDGMCGVHEHDFGLAGSGILIWHIDETRLGSNISANTVNVDPDHKGVDLEEADGLQDFDYSLPDIYGYEGSEYDPWFQGGYAWEFSPWSEPSSDASWGGRTFVTVDVLDEVSDVMDVKVSRSTIRQGWPLQSTFLAWGPVVWKDADPSGDRLVVTTSSGYPLAYTIDGEGPEFMGRQVTARPVTGNPSSGDPLLLLCDDDGQVHLRDIDWNEPSGWPVTIPGGGSGVSALVSSRLGIVAVADDLNRITLFDASGERLSGHWPVQVQAPVAGIAVYPDEDEPGIIASTRDGRVYLWDLQGNESQGWPVSPGSEETSHPISADIDRDGSADVVVASGDQVYAWDRGAQPLPGFPARLPYQPLSAPCFADLDNDGRLETVVSTWGGVSAVGPSGSTLENWPVDFQMDSLVSGFDPENSGIGGRGFTLVGLDDGRICLLEGSGSQPGIFPVSVGDSPVGRPVLWDPDNTGDWVLAAADANGDICCWNTDYQPQGWFTGLDESGSNCWWEQDLPPLVQSGDILRDGSFYVYPNPVDSGSGTVRFQPGQDCSWVIRIFNMGGDLVSYMSGTAPGGAAWEESWDTENLAPGVYFVTLHIDSEAGSKEAVFHAAVIN